MIDGHMLNLSPTGSAGSPAEMAMRGVGLQSPHSPDAVVNGFIQTHPHVRADLEKDNIIKLERVQSSPPNESNIPKAVHAIGEPRSDPDRAGEIEAILSER